MGKYSTLSKPQPKPRNKSVHPVMRGIGCILMIVVPILAYGISILLVGYGGSHGWPIPANFYGPPSIPAALWKSPGLQPILLFLQEQQNLEANLVFTVAITAVIGGIMSIVYGYIYTLFGPPKYGPQDSPPVRKKVKRYTR